MASEYDLRKFEGENGLYKPFSPSSLSAALPQATRECVL